jgi:hypothetical protein
MFGNLGDVGQDWLAFVPRFVPSATRKVSPFGMELYIGVGGNCVGREKAASESVRVADKTFEIDVRRRLSSELRSAGNRYSNESMRFISP